MPELPEVETIRAGLEAHLPGRRIREVHVLRDRSVRRHEGGAVDFAATLTGRTITGVVRRGKFLWFPLDDGRAMLAHLGMSGQFLARPAGSAPVPAARVLIEFDDAQLCFVDQRTFGYVMVAPMEPTADGGPGGHGDPAPLVPQPAAHIARDLFDPLVAYPEVAAAIRRRGVGIKRQLLDQQLVSGIGNIYADEGLWRAGMHYDRPGDRLRVRDALAVLAGCREVMLGALAAGGTSFDALYVGVDGSSGFFERSLAVYGREGTPCPRCGVAIVREPFMNRSSYRCPRCQPRPRTRAAGGRSGAEAAIRL